MNPDHKPALAQHARRQRALLAMLKGRAPDAKSLVEDSYLQAVAASPRLAVLQDIDVFWKEHSFLGTCPFTAGLLQTRGQLRDQVHRLIREQSLSPFVEEMSRAFLESMAAQPERLLATVAQFELALSRTALGDLSEYRIAWTEEPYALLGRILGGIDPVYAAVPPTWETVVSAALPQRFEVRPLAA